MGELGLLPFVKRFQFHRGDYVHYQGISPDWLFDSHTLRHFSALTSVQELGIDYLQISTFMPRIRQYVGHFMPTVRSLALNKPQGTSRQIVHFIGLFEHLEDLKLVCRANHRRTEDGPNDDQGLIPPFIPPLRGRLTMMHFVTVELLEDMTDLFRGMRFSSLNLYDAQGTRLLLDACAKTLETLQVYPTDPRANRDLDLSRNKSLRTLQVTAWSVGEMLKKQCPDSGLARTLSTIASRVFSDVTVLYRDYDIRGAYSPHPNVHPPQKMSQAELVREAKLHFARFGMYRAMHEVRDFRLVLCADVWDGVGEYAVRMLKEAVVVEKVARGLMRSPNRRSLTVRGFPV